MALGATASRGGGFEQPSPPHVVGFNVSQILRIFAFASSECRACRQTGRNITARIDLFDGALIKTRVNLVLTPRRLPRLRHWGLAENLANKVLPPGSQRTSNSKVPCSLCMAFVCEGLARWISSTWCKLAAKSSRRLFWSTALVLSRDLLQQLARPLAGPATLCDR